ncbi:peptidoglycan-binding protein [uncultured Subdoligranulum sp.]|uniref:peptidoglycan-binding domain-containing protein n=1 Tax=uncultured Subdoligranulum sp. TaxID=512298 RepID=UPI00320A7A31
MPNGTLRVYASVADQAAPLAGVRLAVQGESGTVLARLETDAAGAAGPLSLEAPDARYSLEEDNRTVRPYAVYRLIAEADSWQGQILDGVQVFAGQETVARLSFLPAAPADAPTLADTRTEEQHVEITTIPPHVLFAGGGGSGPTPEESPDSRVLSEVVIPKKITVHLGKPSANVSNVTVGFQEYIANVASSEIYPTWPEQAIRANILAQISLALNRIWTEWYPSRGYAFNITGSPGYDQAYVAGRTVFAVMERITAELFNTYVRRSGDQEPYYTEYCDGKLVTCPGMKQWGTVDRANEGKSALEILRYYYGSRVQLVTSNNIAAIPSSWPGVTLKRGSTGTSVRILQRQLSRIAKDYPSFGKPEVTGTFDAATEQCVKNFQKQFSLTADGLVGKATWYKISYIYVSVKDLAELTSEGETATGTESSGSWPGVVLRRGSGGSEVEQVQFWLSELAQFNSALPDLTVDGSFGAATEKAVKIFQQEQGLTADGVVGQSTWNALYAAWVSMQSDLGGTAWPGVVLRRGDNGMDVRLVQYWLRLAAENYAALSSISVDGNFGAATQRAITGFQTLFGLTADGLVGRATWNKLNEVALAVANQIVEPDVAPGQFTTTVREGSRGTAVRAVQYYLRRLSAYYSDIPSVTVDGVFGAATTRAVKAWQTRAGLTADGVVGQLTWNSLYSAAQALADSGPVVRSSSLPAPASTLQPGDSGASVLRLDRLLLFLGQWLPEINFLGSTTPNDGYSDDLAITVRSAQRYFGLPETGEVSPADWEVFLRAARALAEVNPAAAAPEPDGIWPAAALTLGSSGPAVRQVQRWLNRIASVDQGYSFVPETGDLDEATQAALENYQLTAGLPTLGVVDAATWESLRTAALALCSTCQQAEEG